MASGGVSIKMGVTGVAKFKQDIGTAKQQIKTMDADLALLEKQFKASGDAETYMQQKTELLKAKLEEQKVILGKAESALKDMKEKGVSPASTAFQEMQRQVIAAKSGMIDTQTQLENVGDAAAAAATETETMNEQLDNIGKQVSVQNVVDGLDKITGGLEAAAKKAVDLGKKIVKNVLGVGSWADDINTRSKVLGVSPEDLQRMEKTATLIDTDAEVIIKARQKLAKGIGKGGAATDALEALGISGEGDMEDVFWAAGEAIMALTDETEQEAKANDLFGKSWHELIPLFSAGREEYEEMNDSWNVMTQEQLDQLNKMDDEYQKLQIQLDDLKRTALAELAEPMKEALTAVNELLGKIGDWLKSDEGKATVENVVTAITDGMKWIVENKETVVAALGAIVGGWGLLKLTGGALKVYELITGLKGLGLFGGGSGAGTAAGAGSVAKGAGLGATAKGLIAANGASLLAPMAVMGVGMAPALIAQGAEESKARAKQASRIANAVNLHDDNAWFLESAANALGFGENGNGRWGDMADVDRLLSGMNSRGVMEKAKLANLLRGSYTSAGYDTWADLNRYWAGEEMDPARVTAILEAVTDAYDRLAQETEESKKAEETMSKDADSLEKTIDKLPATITKGLNGVKVIMDSQTVGQIVSEYIAASLQ